VTKRESDFEFTKKIFAMKNRPYWNFWKVVFAGWLIRYPGKFIRPLGILVGFFLVWIYKALVN
jgi:hypothetical protein